MSYLRQIKVGIGSYSENTNVVQVQGNSLFIGDVNVVGVLTANRLYSNIYGEFTGGSISGTNVVGTALSISGISTFGGDVNVNGNIIGDSSTNISGINSVTATSFFGDGSGLENLSRAAKSVEKFIATAGQTNFVTPYQVGYVDVYLNGAKLTADLYTSTSGTNIILDDGAAANDIIEIISFTFLEAEDVVAINIVNDLTPQLGGNLDLNGNDITGTGNVNISGVITAQNGIDVTGGGISGTNIVGTALSISGISTFSGDVNVVGVLTAQNGIDVTGGGISGTNIVGTALSISGASSFGGDVNVVGVLTANRLYSNVYGEFTGGGISGTNIVGTALSISGISTFGNNVFIQGITTSTSFSGDGSNLTGLAGKRIAMAIIFG